MNTMDCIFSRRSIRKFKPDPVGHELLESVIPGGILFSFLEKQSDHTLYRYRRHFYSHENCR